MTSRYFVQPAVAAEQVTLMGSEAHHLMHVMRAARGDRITLFDGSGAEFTAEVDRVDRKEVRLTIFERIDVDRELPVRITLAVALPKGDRQRWLVEKAVELGVAAVVPLVTERSVARPKAQSLARLGRAVVEASKQCGRNRLMEIEEPRAWSDFVQETSDLPWRFVAHPGGSVGRLPTAASFPSTVNEPQSGPAPARQSILAAIGPEGGFSEAEIALATAAGWQKIGLGRRILRTETAAVLLAGIISAPFLE